MTSNKPNTRTFSEVVKSFSLAYIIAIFLLIYPLYIAGVFKVLANTRLLSPLVSAGVIKYNDLDIGFIEGVGDLKNYLMSQSAVDWSLVLFCFIAYGVYFSLKSLQFHIIAKINGLKGGFGNSAVAYFYGLGLNRFFPFAFGDAASVSALVGNKEDEEKSSVTLSIVDKFMSFEIIFFLFISLLLSGWSMTLIQIFPALLFFALCKYLMRPFLNQSSALCRQGQWQDLKNLLSNPKVLFFLCAISIVSFFIDDIVPYVISQAFTEYPVIMNVPFLVIQGGVVAGYIAQRIPITPSGIGQYEVGFGTALYVAGVGMPEAVSIAILDGLLRNSTAVLMFLFVKFRYNVNTNIQKVFNVYRGIPDHETN